MNVKSISKPVICALLALAVVAVACGGPAVLPAPSETPASTPSAQPTPTPAPSPTLPDPAPTNSAQAVENVATIIYDALAAGENLNPYINGVMTAFGVPPLGEADVTLAGTRYNQGLPLMFIPQVAELADAFNDGGFVSLDSFITAANNQGAKQRGTNNPLTREYLTQKFADYAGKAQYEPHQVLPAFVLALGKERAARFPPKNTDSLWGDGLLDPLQLTLLLYSFSYSGDGIVSFQAPLTSGVVHQGMNASFVNGPSRAPLIVSVAGKDPKDPIGDFIKDQIQGQVEGAVQGFVEVPLDKAEAAQVSVCASLLLYGHKMKVTTTPNLIYHNDGSKPWSTRVDVALSFQDDYWDNYLPIDRWMLENLGNCKLPRRGPAEGKPLKWSVSDGLSDHGNFSITASQTNDDGKATANWQTVRETTPEDQRTFNNQRDAVGAVIVRAGSLVPGWSGLEYIVGLLKDTGNTGDSPLTVIYYISQGWIYDYRVGGLVVGDGKKCDGLGGKWVINNKVRMGEEYASGVLVVTIDEKTLRGTYTHNLNVTAEGDIITMHEMGGAASLIVEADGSVTMTLTGGQNVITITYSDGTFTSSIQPLPDSQFLWEPAGDACNGE